MKIRLALVDDHNLYREGLISLLRTIKEIELVNDFANGEDFVSYLENNTDPDPDIVLLDYQMPKLDGIGVCHWLKENKPAIKPIVISQFDGDYIIHKFVQNGAVAYLLKAISKNELLEAIKEVYNNNFYFNDQVSHKLLIDLVRNKSVKPSFIKGTELTRREKEITMLICQELTYKEIASKLNISKRTVEEHKNHILKKIGSTKVTGIVVYAAKRGWV